MTDNEITAMPRKPEKRNGFTEKQQSSVFEKRLGPFKPHRTGARKQPRCMSDFLLSPGCLFQKTVLR
jgi:hypothetical protein